MQVIMVWSYSAAKQTKKKKKKRNKTKKTKQNKTKQKKNKQTKKQTNKQTRNKKQFLLNKIANLEFNMPMAGKTVYFPGSWPIFSQFVLCFYVYKKTKFPFKLQIVPPNTNISNKYYIYYCFRPLKNHP